MSKFRQYGYIPGLIIMIALSAFYSWNWYNEARLHQVIRIHFIANSDRPADQHLKLQVRDTVLKEVAPSVNKATNRDEANQYINTHLTTLQALASKEVERQGYSYPVRVALGERYYGWRTSGGIIFTPGSYTSLTVTIGAGEGHNWWGVLYPPFCLVSETSEKPGKQVRCKMWDLACSVKSRFNTNY